MPINDYKLKPGEILEIKIKDRELEFEGGRFNESSDPDAKMFYQGKRPDLPGRRRIVEGGLFNFYDIVQKKQMDGSFAEWFFDVDEGENAEQDITGSTMKPFQASRWNELNDLIFAVPVETWKDNYKKIGYEEAAKYGLSYINKDGQEKDIEVENSDWTNRGLKFDNEKPFIISYSFFYPILFGDGSYHKITNSLDPDAPEVTFDARKGGDVFLFPRIFQRRANETSGSDDAYLDSYYGFLSRGVFLDRTEVNSYFLDVPPYSEYFKTEPVSRNYFYQQNIKPLGDGASYRDLINDWLKTRAGANYYVRLYPVTSYIPTSPTSYPYFSDADIHYHFRSNYAIPTHFEPVADLLVAIIIQNGTTFYFKKRDTTTVEQDIEWRPAYF